MLVSLRAGRDRREQENFKFKAGYAWKQMAGWEVRRQGRRAGDKDRDRLLESARRTGVLTLIRRERDKKKLKDRNETQGEGEGSRDEWILERTELEEE